MKVALLSTFGPEVRGISYYSDNLLASLQQAGGAEIYPEDYRKIYPDWLYPAQQTSSSAEHNRRIHYGRPGSWKVFTDHPDVIHLQSWTFATALIHRRILRHAHRNGIPTVLTLHNPVSHERFGLLQHPMKECLELADRIILHDDCGLAAIPEPLRNKVRIIAHGTSAIEATGDELESAAGQSPYLLYFGNIRPYKGVELLLDAWSEIAGDFPAVKLVIAGRLWQGKSLLSNLVARLLGTARQARQLQQLESNAAVPRVDYRFGFIPDTELDSLISNACYAVFPYLKFSGQSGAVARAAAQGTPVLVSSAGGLSVLAIGPENIFQAGDREGLAWLLQSKLNNLDHNPAERRSQLAKARSLSWEHSAVQHLALYQELHSGIRSEAKTG
ncbi:MAG: glycosyltransferase [Gammaproteobacteria bacterium]|nr:glycosyltransferase [Pseudomonadales bacterium]MCP5346143.1 glycosyltransferase [Pseudomonadales bacterium]